MSNRFYPAAEIAEALNVSKKTVQRRAETESWPRVPNGNRFDYAPPAAIAERMGMTLAAEASPEQIEVTFSDIANKTKEAAKVRAREEAVLFFESQKHLGIEAALKSTVAHFYTNKPNAFVSAEVATDFKISISQLRRWIRRYEAHGLNGLVEQKQGRVGRKGVFVPDTFRNLGKALRAEHGSVARAARELALHPDLPAEMRQHLHGGHASKSYVTPSIRNAIEIAPLTETLLQGPRAARLAGRFTPGNYDEVKAGDVFVSDDMTSNVVCWCEWPNAVGWRLGQVQILPVLDVGSLRWLNVRVIMRDSGQYNSDDIWGLFGDTFDRFGLPRSGFVLEGGHWQSKKVIGDRTGLDDEARVGGLESLGLKVFRSFDPRSKIIEGQFNQLQFVMDRFPGFVGRDQRTDLPEVTKKKLALCSGKAPQHHPKEFFPHVSQLADQVKLAMEKLNQERQDGKVLRGMSPLEKWGHDNPKLDEIPDSARWLYRSCMNVVKVTINGVRVTRGSGAKMEVYYYDNPELLVPRQGRKVTVYWNDYNPEADAVIVENGKFIGIARYVKPLGRFSATREELSAEAQRKQAAMKYARTEIRTMEEHLVRRTTPVPVGPEAVNIGRQITQAAEEATARQKTQAHARRIDVDPADLLGEPTERFSTEDVTESVATEAVAELDPEALL